VGVRGGNAMGKQSAVDAEVPGRHLRTMNKQSQAEASGGAAAEAAAEAFRRDGTF
jgi:hypothetical protein